MDDRDDWCMISVHESLYEGVIMALDASVWIKFTYVLVSSLLGLIGPTFLGEPYFVGLLAALGLSATALLAARSVVSIRRGEYGRVASQEQTV
jgi:hypothetical protein